MRFHEFDADGSGSIGMRELERRLSCAYLGIYNLKPNPNWRLSCAYLGIPTPTELIDPRALIPRETAVGYIVLAMIGIADKQGDTAKSLYYCGTKIKV